MNQVNVYSAVFKPIIVILVSLLVSTFVPLATAQEEKQERKPEDNWLKVCGDTEDPYKPVCVMRQTIAFQGRFAGSFILKDDPRQDARYTITAAVPNGVFLPAGMLWQIDEDRALKVNYVICDVQSCLAQAAVPPAYIESLKKGGKLKLIAKNPQRKDFTVEVNLIGFTSVFNSEGLDVEQFQRSSTGEVTLQKRLNDIAKDISDN